MHVAQPSAVPLVLHHGHQLTLSEARYAIMIRHDWSWEREEARRLLERAMTPEGSDAREALQADGFEVRVLPHRQ